jgi:hypothetical protein
MIAVYIVLVGELAKIVAGEAVAKAARTVALVVLAAVAAGAALAGEVQAGAVWGSPLSDLVWALDVAMVLETIVALLLTVVLGTRGCEIGVWADIAARRRGRPASPPLCIVGLHHLDDWELRRRPRATSTCPDTARHPVDDRMTPRRRSFRSETRCAEHEPPSSPTIAATRAGLHLRAATFVTPTILSRSEKMGSSVLLSAAWRVRLSDPTLGADLIHYLRTRAYLAQDRGVVTVMPTNSVSERADQARFERDLTAWRAGHADVEADVLEGNA